MPPRSPCVLSPNLPIIPSPSTYCRPDVLLGFLASGLPDHERVVACLQASASLGLRLWNAGSPRQSAESSLLALRTDRSPPGCSPPRLSATQLPSVTECQFTPARTFTLLIRCNYRRTSRHTPLCRPPARSARLLQEGKPTCSKQWSPNSSVGRPKNYKIAVRT